MTEHENNEAVQAVENSSGGVIFHTAESSQAYLVEVERLTEELATARTMSLMFQEDIRKKNNIINGVTELVQEEFDKDGWDEDDQFFQGLCRYLDIKTTEETDVIITVKWSVKVTHPKGFDLSDISVDVDEPNLDSDKCEFASIDQYSVEIDED